MRWIISIPLLLSLGGCADFGYYWHNARGHLAVMDKRVDIPVLLADEALDARLRTRLQLVQQIRDFSISRLSLPDNDSYRSYADLGRPWLVQNLFAAPEFSTRLRQWCYPVIGCASYRGYYDPERLLAYANELQAAGLEVYIGNVPAYSTLGWFDDPVLSSFIEWPDFRLAGLLFHELTHQRIYIDDDTTFNESLASAVQQAGTELWLQSLGRDDDLRRLSDWQAYRGAVIALIEGLRERLDGLYREEIDDQRKRDRKAAMIAEARLAHDALAAERGIAGGYRQWFAEGLNNARIGSIAAYNAEAPAFLRMLRAHHTDFELFFAYAEKLGKLEKSRRDACLLAWRNAADPAADNACPAASNGPATASS